jgi:hypothetical protein
MQLTDNGTTIVLDETTAKVRSYNGIPVLIYYDMEYDHGDFKKANMTIVKLSAFVGSIKTDGGTVIEFKDLSLTEKIAKLVQILKQDFTPGAIDELELGGTSGEIASDKIYEDLDKNGKATITITIWQNPPSGSELKDSTVKNFSRKGDAIYASDIVALAPKVEGYTILGIALGKKLDAVEKDCLGPKDKLLEDQEVTFVWGKAISLTVSRSLIDEDKETVSVSVPYNARLSEAVDLIKADATVQGWIAAAAENKVAFVDVVKADGTEFSNSNLKKAAANFVEAGVALSWAKTEEDEPVSNTVNVSVTVEEGLTGVIAPEVTSANKGKDLTLTFTGDNAASLVEANVKTITVSGDTVEYTLENGVITIAASAVTGDVVVVLGATE